MWTYSGNPGSNPKDAVRFLIGDTDKADPLLLDTEINFCLSIFDDHPLNAAILACESIVSKFARMADETVGQVKILYSQKSKQYREKRDDLRTRIALYDIVPYAGGISVSDKKTQVQNSDRVKPDFSKHMMENEQIAPWTTAQEVNTFEGEDEGI